jgi:hypothetical protein
MAFFSSLLAASIFHLARANVIGIDFGSDSFKVALVQPGSPLDIGNISLSLTR